MCGRTMVFIEITKHFFVHIYQKVHFITSSMDLAIDADRFSRMYATFQRLVTVYLLILSPVTDVKVELSRVYECLYFCSQYV